MFVTRSVLLIAFAFSSAVFALPVEVSPRGCGGQGGLSCNIIDEPVISSIPSSSIIATPTTVGSKRGCGGQGGLSCNSVSSSLATDALPTPDAEKRQICGGIGRPSCDTVSLGGRAVATPIPEILEAREVCGGQGQPSCD